jgi:hypothetical protein
MRRFLGTLLLLTALAGCGDDDGGTTDQPAPQEPAEPGLVQMLVLTSAGGEVSPTAYFVDDRKQMKAYVKTFEDRDQVIESLQQAAEDAGDHEGRLAAATVFIGCDTPSDVHVTEGEDGWEVHPKKVPDSKLQCFAPMTSIALVEIP